jgi:hypothetical protein
MFLKEHFSDSARLSRQRLIVAGRLAEDVREV